jgi:hypothetical protein
MSQPFQWASPPTLRNRIISFDLPRVRPSCSNSSSSNPICEKVSTLLLPSARSRAEVSSVVPSAPRFAAPSPERKVRARPSSARPAASSHTAHSTTLRPAKSSSAPIRLRRPAPRREVDPGSIRSSEPNTGRRLRDGPNRTPLRLAGRGRYRGCVTAKGSNKDAPRLPRFQNRAQFGRSQ